MKEQELIDELKKIREFFWDNEHYETSTHVGLAIDALEDLFFNKEWYGYEDDSLQEVRKIIRKTIKDSRDSK